MSAKSYKYIGIRYKQGNGGQDLLTFCASAQEIRAWAGVPTKTERFHGGFQRALTDRYKKISQFFDAGHSSPTSIVVAFRSQALALDDLGFPSAWPGTANGLTAMPTFTQVSFTADDADPDTADLEQLRTAVCAMLKPRLEESGDTAENTTEEAEEDDEEDAPSIEDAPGEEGEDEPVLDVGHSKLRQFYDFLNSPEAVEAWLAEQNAKKAEITARGPRGRAEREFIQIDPDSRLRAALVSLLKPAMIVDGQHRVSGAYHAESGPITFNVCAIKDADWVEHPQQPGLHQRLRNRGARRRRQVRRRPGEAVRVLRSPAEDDRLGVAELRHGRISGAGPDPVPGPTTRSPADQPVRAMRKPERRCA